MFTIKIIFLMRLTKINYCKKSINKKLFTINQKQLCLVVIYKCYALRFFLIKFLLVLLINQISVICIERKNIYMKYTSSEKFKSYDFHRFCKKKNNCIYSLLRFNFHIEFIYEILKKFGILLNMHKFLCTCTYILIQADVFSFGIMLCQLIARLPCDPDKLPRSNDFGLSVDQYQGILKSIPTSIQSAPPPQFLQLAFDCCKVIISCSFYKDVYC